MKTEYKIIVAGVISVGILFYLLASYHDNRSEDKNSVNLTGTYSLDLDKTNLGIYQSEKNEYEKLTLTIKPDYSFQFSRKVPFIYDSAGTWKPAGSGIDEWNTFYYQSENYSGRVSGEHVSRCSDEGRIYMNSTTPQKGNQSIPEIWFKKH